MGKRKKILVYKQERPLSQGFQCHSGLVHLPCELEVMGLSPGRNRPKSVKLVVVAFSLGAQVSRNSRIMDCLSTG